MAQLKNVICNIEDWLRELTVSLDDDVGVLLVRRLPPQPVSCLRLQTGQREDLVALLKNFNKSHYNTKRSGENTHPNRIYFLTSFFSSQQEC